MDNGPITVVATGSSVKTATGANILLNSTIPFTKLDTQNIVSFQTISILFNHEPPDPVILGGYTNTSLYTFPHGYSYISAPWLTWQNDSPQYPSIPPSGSFATTYRAFGDDTSSLQLLDSYTVNPEANPSAFATNIYNDSGTIDTAADATVIVTVDSTNMYISLLKQNYLEVSGSVSTVTVLGFTLNIRCYAFAEPANTSTY